MQLHDHTYSYNNKNSGYLTSEEDDDDTKLSVLPMEELMTLDMEVNSNEIVKLKTNQSKLNVANKSKLSKLLTSYSSEVAQKPNHVKDYEFTNDLIKLIAPRVCRPYSIPVSILPQAKQKINDMVEQGFIRPVHSSVYNNPAFFQMKPNGTLRLLFNAKYINEHLARRAVVIPTIDQLLYNLGEGMWFTAIDQTGAYNQLLVNPIFGKYLVFTLEFGSVCTSECHRVYVLHQKHFKN